MSFEELIASHGVYVASFVVGFVSGFVPFINAEVYLVLASPLLSKPALLPVAGLSALGQMAAKTIIYFAGRGVFSLKMGKYESRIGAVQTKFAAWGNRAGVLVLLSATVGFPPFYVLSFVAGALKYHLALFITAGLTGRTIRFTAVVYFPQLIQRWL